MGQHRQLRLAVVNLGGEPAQGFIPLALPEFAGKTVHLDDQLDDVSYERPGDDLLVRGLYVDLPPYGHHLFRVTRDKLRRPAGAAARVPADRPPGYPSGASSSRA